MILYIVLGVRKNDFEGQKKYYDHWYRRYHSRKSKRTYDKRTRDKNKNTQTKLKKEEAEAILLRFTKRQRQKFYILDTKRQIE